MGKDRIEKQRQFHELETLVKSLEAAKVKRLPATELALGELQSARFESDSRGQEGRGWEGGGRGGRVGREVQNLKMLLTPRASSQSRRQVKL